MDLAMKLVMLKCRSCGANLNVSPGQRLVTCQYCGTEFLVDKNGGMDAAGEGAHEEGGLWTTKHMLVLGVVLFGAAFIAYATNSRFRLLGFSIQALCLFAYAAVLVRFRRVCRTKAGKALSIAIWALTFFVVVAQIIFWINNKSFTLLQLS